MIGRVADFLGEIKDGKKVLVTGAGGFVGSFLMNALQGFGYDVVGLLHRSTEIRPVLRGCMEVCDMSQPLCLQGSFDAVVHAAGLSQSSGFSFAEYKHGNIDTMENLLNWIHQGHARRVIYLSAMSVYGEIKDETVDEDTPIVNPGPYGLSKYVAECLLDDAKDIEHLSLRLPGVFGKKARYPWLAKVVEKCIKGNAVIIHSPDFINNNYLYLPDLAVFIDKLLCQDDWQYQKLVLGLQHGISIREAVETVHQTIGSKSEIKVIEAIKNPFCIDTKRAETMGYRSHEFQMMISECLSNNGWIE